MFLIVNLAIIVAYITSLMLRDATGVVLPLHIAGFVWLVFITPYNLTKLFKIECRGGIEKYFSWLTLFFFLFVPLYYVAHRIAGVDIIRTTLLFINLGIFTLAYLVLFIGSPKSTGKQLHLFQITPRSLFSHHRLLVVGLLLFAVTHMVNYSFYTFIPETDGYRDIQTIERHMEGEEIRGGRKPAFYMAMTSLATFAEIEPYTLSSFWMIALQSTLVLAVYMFIRLFKVQGSVVSFLVLATAVAVPVINMEVDIVRAQTLYVLAFPIWVYFLYQALVKKEMKYWLFGGIISIFGMLYHELFFFLVAAYVGIMFWALFVKYYRNAEAGKDKTIFALSVALAVSLIYSFAQEFRAVRFTFTFIERQWGLVTDTSEWQWWFLDSYATDVDGMGWHGIWGAAQYYGYYVTPSLVLLFGATVVLAIVYWKNTTVRPLLIILVPLLGVYLVFAEVLPRINAPYLPERFWLLITMALVIMAAPVAKMFDQFVGRRILRTSILFCYGLLILVGVSGSFYVAQGKGATTSPAEYEAAMWIRENTEDDAIFITQGKNSQMIRFFGRRSMVTPDEEFFLSDELISFLPEDQTDRITRAIEIEQQRISEAFEDLQLMFEKGDGEMEALSLDYVQSVKAFAEYIEGRYSTISQLRRGLEELEGREDPVLYVLYSEDKFNTIYAQREWWRERNFYGANLEKFNEAYLTVYDQDGVTIWKAEE